MINTDNIQVGQVFKSTKSLLIAVGLQQADELITGNTFRARLKTLQLYVSYERVPHSQQVIITEIKR